MIQDLLYARLPKTVSFEHPEGGFFIWLRFPEHVNTDELRETARRVNVDFLPGSFFSSRQALKNYMRLSFAFYDGETLKTGIERLGSAVDTL